MRFINFKELFLGLVFRANTLKMKERLLVEIIFTDFFEINF